MERSPEFRQLLIGMSTNRYFPPSGTAGFARSFVNGNSRVPAPPPMMMARVRWVVPGGSAGACIALMWPQTGFAARKIFAASEKSLVHAVVIPSREDGEGPRPRWDVSEARSALTKKGDIARATALIFSGIRRPCAARDDGCAHSSTALERAPEAENML